MKILFIAAASNLRTSEEILASAQGLTLSLCDGYVDRDKAERFLAEDQDGIHFAGHGDASILAWSDGPIEEQELVSMIGRQPHLRFVLITACNSAGVGNAIHNALHVPVISCQAPIEDPAAIRFSETFYRALRLTNNLKQAFEAGRATVARLAPGSANVVTMVNGDMATETQLKDCMTFVKQELGEMRVQLDSIEASVAELKHGQPKVVVIVLVLLGALLVAQMAQPWLMVAVGR